MARALIKRVGSKEECKTMTCIRMLHGEHHLTVVVLAQENTFHATSFLQTIYHQNDADFQNYHNLLNELEMGGRGKVLLLLFLRC